MQPNGWFQGIDPTRFIKKVKSYDNVEVEFFFLASTMVLILDGNLELDAHERSNRCYLIFLRHWMYREQSQISFSEKTFMREQHTHKGSLRKQIDEQKERKTVIKNREKVSNIAKQQFFSIIRRHLS